MPPFAAQHSLFRAYDIRGAQQYFTDDFLHALGIAFAQLYAQNFASQTHHATHNSTQAINTVVIGFDVRCGSHHIARTLARLLIEHGVQVVELGLVTTPMMAFWSEQYEGHGIMVTASHNPKSDNGIKWIVQGEPPCPDAIQQVGQLAQLSISNIQPCNEFDTIAHQMLPQYCLQYQHALISDIQLSRPLKVVLDGLHGSAKT